MSLNQKSVNIVTSVNAAKSYLDSYGFTEETAVEHYSGDYMNDYAEPHVLVGVDYVKPNGESATLCLTTENEILLNLESDSLDDCVVAGKVADFDKEVSCL